VTDDSSKDPIDINYEKLKTNIEVVDSDSEEAEVIRKYVKNIHATTHNAYDLKVIDIFKIEHEGESQHYKPFKQLHNWRLLWHGSRTTNFADILSQVLQAGLSADVGTRGRVSLFVLGIASILYYYFSKIRPCRPQEEVLGQRINSTTSTKKSITKTASLG
ncbi:hypothetical protein A6R68_01759, partial [Neotoma lepida]